MTPKTIHGTHNLCSESFKMRFSDQLLMPGLKRNLSRRTRQCPKSEKMTDFGARGGHSFTSSTNFKALKGRLMSNVQQRLTFVSKAFTQKVILDHSVPEHVVLHGFSMGLTAPTFRLDSLYKVCTQDIPYYPQVLNKLST